MVLLMLISTTRRPIELSVNHFTDEMFNLTIYGFIQKHCSADLQILAFATLYALFRYSLRASADFFPRRTNYQIHHLNPILSLSHDAL